MPQQLLSHLDLCWEINSTSTWLRVLPLLLRTFMPLLNAASWISMLRTIAYLLLDQLFQPVKMRFCCHLADTLHYSSIKVYPSAIQPHHITSRRVCLLLWLVSFCYSACCGVSNVTKAQASVSLEWNWGLMARLWGFASHGGNILSRGWLATEEAPGYPRHSPST